MNPFRAWPGSPAFWPGRRRPGVIDELACAQGGALGQLVEGLPVGVVVVDAGLRILRTNRLLRQMAAGHSGLAPGQPVAALFHPAEQPMVARVLAAALAPGAPPPGFTAAIDLPEADPDHAVEVSGLALTEADGRTGGLYLCLADATARRRLERQLVHSRKLQAVGQLAGGIAHDFNNLLTVILGAADLAAVLPEAGPETLAELRQIRACAERGAALVRQLLAFGRQQTLLPQVVEINEAIRAVAAMLERLLGGRIRLVLDLETPGRRVLVDPGQLDQVLINLAVNARDAMKEGGTLTLRSGHRTLLEPLLRGAETIPPGRYVLIEVEDTGTGIPAELLSRVFDPYFTTRREQGGNGLGLATVLGIIRQSEGFIEIASRQGQGTQVRVYLPRHDGPSHAVVQPMPTTAPAATPASRTASAEPVARRLLLVEDEPALRRLAERALQRQGWTVLSADSAAAALALLGEPADWPADLVLVISDVVLPGMDGPALLEAVRRVRPELPAILVSGYAEEVLRRGLAVEHTVVVTKPCALAALVETADRLAGPAAGDAGSGAAPPVSA